MQPGEKKEVETSERVGDIDLNLDSNKATKNTVASSSRNVESIQTQEGEIKNLDNHETNLKVDRNSIPSLRQHHVTVPIGVVTHVLVEGINIGKPLREGSTLWCSETKAPLGEVDGIHGSVTEPSYLVRLVSERQVAQGMQVSFVEEFAQRYDDEALREIQQTQSDFARSQAAKRKRTGEEQSGTSKKKNTIRWFVNLPNSRMFQNPKTNQPQQQLTGQMQELPLGVQPGPLFGGQNYNPQMQPQGFGLFSDRGDGFGSEVLRGQAPRMQMVNPVQQQITRPNFGGQGSTSISLGGAPQQQLTGQMPALRLGGQSGPLVFGQNNNPLMQP